MAKNSQPQILDSRAAKLNLGFDSSATGGKHTITIVGRRGEYFFQFMLEEKSSLSPSPRQIMVIKSIYETDFLEHKASEVGVF